MLGVGVWVKNVLANTTSKTDVSKFCRQEKKKKKFYSIFVLI